MPLAKFNASGRNPASTSRRAARKVVSLVTWTRVSSQRSRRRGGQGSLRRQAHAGGAGGRDLATPVDPPGAIEEVVTGCRRRDGGLAERAWRRAAGCPGRGGGSRPSPPSRGRGEASAWRRTSQPSQPAQQAQNRPSRTWSFARPARSFTIVSPCTGSFSGSGVSPFFLPSWATLSRPARIGEPARAVPPP